MLAIDEISQQFPMPPGIKLADWLFKHLTRSIPQG